MKNVLFILGTRPEAIKLAPLIMEFKKNSDFFKTKVCITSQHKEMLQQVLNFFKLKPDYDLDLMKVDQSLFELTSNGLNEIGKILEKNKFDLIIVQGDTTSAFVGALAGYYCKIPVVHIEAGLRSQNIYSPFPEEANRILISKIAKFHFAPTLSAKRNLYKENIKENVFIVGNTIVDALLVTLNLIKSKSENYYKKSFNYLDFNKKIVLITCHRRENFGNSLKNICFAIKELANNNKEIEFVFPAHLNPNVQKPVLKILSNFKNVHIISPLTYPLLIWLMSKSHIVMTDSGGIQEEASILGKPVLVMRENTERMESVKNNIAILVGANTSNIIKTTKKLLSNDKMYKLMSKSKKIYGNGDSCEKIVYILKNKI